MMICHLTIGNCTNICLKTHPVYSILPVYSKALKYINLSQQGVEFNFFFFNNIWGIEFNLSHKEVAF